MKKPGGSVRGERANLKGLVLGCVEAKFARKYALESSRRDLHTALLCSNDQHFFFFFRAQAEHFVKNR